MSGHRLAFGRIELLLGFLLLAACGGGGSSSNSTSPVPSPEASRPGNGQTLPVIAEQPQEQRVPESQIAHFSVQANSATALSYQWLRDGVPIPGATQATYSLVASLADDGARFSVSLTNQGGSVTSSAAVLHVDTAPSPATGPSITVQPASTSVMAGQPAVFSVEVSGTIPLTYQWERDGVPIPNATEASYTLPITATADTGAHFVVRVSNSAGSVSSAAVVLTVLPAPVVPRIAALHGPAVLNRGDTVTLTVVAYGTAPLTYQWRRNGVAIAGATAESYVIGPTTLDDHFTAYSVVVSNMTGAATSAPIVLRIAEEPRISGGRHFSIAASRTGVLTWGSNYRLPLGRNPELELDTLAGTVAVPLPAGAKILDIAAGDHHGLALRSDGTVWAWGSNSEGALGIDEVPCCSNPLEYDRAVQAHLPQNVIAEKVVAGLGFSIALDTTGKVWGWGTNEAGQTGVGFAGGEKLTNGRLSPVAAALPLGIVDIATGESFALALDADGNVWCWGSNVFGGFSSSAPVVLELHLPAGIRPTRVFAGEHHAFLIDNEGSAWAWGDNDRGELGVGDTPPIQPVTTARKVQLALPSGVVIVAVASGEDHTLFLTSDGSVHASGSEEYGALGNGQSRYSTLYKTPQRALTVGPPNNRAIAISAGRRHSLAILSDGTVMGWGANWVGELGDSTRTHRPAPVTAVGVDLDP